MIYITFYIAFVEPFSVEYRTGSKYEEVIKKEFNKLMFNKYRFNCIKLV